MVSPLSEIFKDLEHTPAAYLKLSRRFAGEFSGELAEFRVAFLSSFNLDSTAPFLGVEAARNGFLLDSWFAPFGQIEQQALNPASPLFTSPRDAIVVATQLEDIAADATERFAILESEGQREIAESVLGRFKSLVAAIRKGSDAPILFSNFPHPRFPAFGISDASVSAGQAEFVSRINKDLAQLASESDDVFILDIARLVSVIGSRVWYDDKLASLARVPFGFEGQVAFSALLAKWIRALRQPPCKCLVVDFDNTLWGGVVGEDGIDGIRLGPDPPGNAFVWFQKYLLGLKDRGVLLAAASKNNAEEALAVFSDHPDCVLSAEDFSASEIHWEDKATSIRNIAAKLGIGLDAIAFFDDNPVERDWVQSQLPEVTVIEFPSSPIHFRQALENSGAFEAIRFTEEDKLRAKMLRQVVKRQSLSDQSITVEDFLRGLQMEISVGNVSSETITRVSQLVTKTNQFNLTTRRHSAAAIQKMTGSGAVALWLRLRDRFGDQGLVGVAIAIPECGQPGRWSIDTFLLSCRVLAREVESALLSLLSRCVKERDGREIIGEYIPTSRNSISANLFRDHGFTPLESSQNQWRFDLETKEIPLPDLFILDDQIS